MPRKKIWPRARYNRGSQALKVSQSVRFSVDEHLKMRRAAFKAHLTISDYIRSKVPECQTNGWPIKLKV